MRIKWTVWGVFVIALGGLLSSSPSPSLALPPANEELTPHSPIVIRRDAAFTPENGVRSGSGTPEDPYIIEGWAIDAAGGDLGIALFSTNAYVVIRNCAVQSAQQVGIRLDQAEHVTIENCRVSRSKRGFQITDSQDVQLADNLAEFNREGGFFVFNSQNVEFVGNRAWYNWKVALNALKSWGFFSDERSQTRGRDNRSAGHAVDVLILQASSSGDPLDLFSNPKPAPETSCTQIFSEFFLYIGYLEGTEPLTEPYCALLLSILRALPEHMRGKIAQFIMMPESEELAGAYTGVGTVRLFANVRHLKDFVDTTNHEIGHVLHDRLVIQNEWQQWVQLHRRAGSDSDGYAITNADIYTRRALELLHYGMLSPFEDFATIFEAYMRDTEAAAYRARLVEENAGKRVLREKFAFVVKLFRGLPYAYRTLLDWDTQANQAQVRIQRARVEKLKEGLPMVTDELAWEEF
jgi:parallel beta-helix repeat protein